MISRIINRDGNRFFEIDGKEFLPAAFRSFRPTPANVSLFYRNGIRLFQMQVSGIDNSLSVPYSAYGGVWVGDHEYDFSAFDRQMEMFMRFAPDGYFMIFAVLDMPTWWREKYRPDAYTFYELGNACLEKKWVEDASDYLCALITYAEEKYGDRIYGYAFAAGGSNEWFLGQIPPNEKRAEAFRKYINDPDIHIPTHAEIKDKSLPTLLDSDGALFKYNRFCAELAPDLILGFASKIQEVLNHRKIVGAFYGYTMLPIGWVNQMGIAGYERVWKSGDIDMIFSPAAYYNARHLNGVSTYQVAVNSLELENKLYLHEIDHRTYLAEYPLDNSYMMHTEYKDEAETLIVLRRELCTAAAKGGALWWFDFFGGYYASPGLEAELRLQMGILDRLSKMPRESVSEIAVFIDPKSLNYMKDQTAMPFDFTRKTRDALNECGAPYDLFNQNDLTKIDTEKYKMFVFINALEISDEVKTAISEKLSDKAVVWMYAPNYYSGGIDEICPIRLREKTDSEAKIEYKGEMFGFTDPAAPMFEVDDKEAEILARYQDGTPACAKKGNRYYIATAKATPALWRDIAKESGVHIYTDKNSALYVDSRFIARQTMYEEDIELDLPFDCVLEEAFDGGIYRTENKKLRYKAKNGKTKMFIITKRL